VIDQWPFTSNLWNMWLDIADPGMILIAYYYAFWWHGGLLFIAEIISFFNQERSPDSPPPSSLAELLWTKILFVLACGTPYRQPNLPPTRWKRLSRHDYRYVHIWEYQKMPIFGFCDSIRINSSSPNSLIRSQGLYLSLVAVWDDKIVQLIVRWSGAGGPPRSCIICEACWIQRSCCKDLSVRKY
jgi:hypothetical protein